jgi:hypothetical protein
MSKPSLIVIDNFYDNPIAIRELALRSSFDQTGNYPGKRTLPIYCNAALGNNLAEFIGEKIKVFGGNDNGAFQITTGDNTSWIHADEGVMWAGVVYLTPDAPQNTGTVFYKHKTSGSRTSKEGVQNKDANGNNQELWEITDRVANIFNRLILYRGHLWHKSDNYFGDCLENGRLFQVFFFETKP